MSAPRYPIGTLVDMAAIPDEALPRFLSELPTILRQYRDAPAIYAALSQMAGVEVKPLAPIWIDDDLHQRHVTIHSGQGDILFRATAPMNGPKP